MHRVLEKLDGAFSTVVVLLYLGGLGLGTVSYFAGIVTDLGVGAGIGLALALEIHSWLQQRRTYEAYATWTQARRAGAEEDAVIDRRKTFFTNLLVFSLLLSFSMFCSVMFTATYWKPVTLWPPYAVQLVLRGSIIPVLFALTAMLAPLHTDASALLAKTSHDMLDRTLRQMRRQWYGRITKAAKGNLDLSPIGVALMEDAGDREGARRIQLIAAGLDRAEGHGPAVQPAAASAAVTLREMRQLHDGPGAASPGGWDGEDGYTDDSDPQMRAVVNGANGNGANGNGHRGGRGMSASRTGTMHALTAPVAAPDTVRFGPRQPAGSVQGGLRVPTANAAATAAAEWDVLPEEDGSPNVGGMYAPFSQPLPLPRPLHPSEHTPASKRATAARDTAKAADKAKAKGKAKQRREWQADAQAKVDPAASGLIRKQRMDANRPRTESQERFERAVDLAVDLLVARVGPEGEVLHDFHSARNRPLKRAVAQAMKREYDDSDGCSERVVERAEQRWRALMEQGLAPSGQIDDADEIAGLDGMLDEVDYAGDAEGYATTAFAVDDLTAFTDGDK